MKIKHYLFFLLPFALYSCSSTIKTRTSDYDYMNITKTGIIQRPLVTDLVVAQTKSVLEISYNNISLEQAKENALGEFIKKYSCDIIVQPMFDISTESKNDDTKIAVKLSGYPASFKDIRNFELKDTASFVFFNRNNSNTVLMTQPESLPATPAKAPVNYVDKQDKQNSGWGIEAFAAEPTGNSKDYYKSGLGGGVFYKLAFKSKIHMNYSLHYANMTGKTYTIPFFSYKEPDLELLTYSMGAGYTTPINIFLDGNIGAAYNLNAGQDNKVSFAYNIGLGYQWHKAHVKVVMQNYGSDSKFMMLNVGFRL